MTVFSTSVRMVATCQKHHSIEIKPGPISGVAQEMFYKKRGVFYIFPKLRAEVTPTNWGQPWPKLQAAHCGCRNRLAVPEKPAFGSNVSASLPSSAALPPARALTALHFRPWRAHHRPVSSASPSRAPSPLPAPRATPHARTCEALAPAERRVAATVNLHAENALSHARPLH